MSAPPPGPTPQRIFDTLAGFQCTAALKAAIDLELFTAIGKGATTAAEIAHACSVPERGVRILCDNLTVLGLLSKTGLRYALAPDSAMFLDRNSPAYIGGTVRFRCSPTLMKRFADLTATVRAGTLADEGTVGDDDPVWVEFARSMLPVMAPLAAGIAQILAATHPKGAPCKVLDMAAGHGIFGVAVAQAIPSAEVVALDWQRVLEVAHETAVAAGVAARHHLLPGNAFEVDYGSDYDVVLVPNFLHHFDPPTCVTLLRKMQQALRPQGRVVVVEFVPNPDRVSPPNAASFSLIMLATTPRGDAYTRAELDEMLREAGFSGMKEYPLPHAVETVVMAQKS
ncbi:MAG: methyltransferase [Terriglobales bacterium]